MRCEVTTVTVNKINTSGSVRGIKLLVADFRRCDKLEIVLDSIFYFLDFSFMAQTNQKQNKISEKGLSAEDRLYIKEVV